jgi:MFS family permease
VAAIPILWTVLNASKLSVAYVGGSLSDRVPRVRLIIFGWGVYALTYLGMGLTKNTLAVWPLFAFYGVYHGLTEPAEKALVKDLSTATERGRAYGAYHFVVGIAAVPAGALAGYLWQKLGPSAAFGLGAGLALLAGVLLLVWEGQMPRGSAAPE